MNELPKFNQIGQPLLRKEDYRLLTGQGRYLDDIAVPGLLHACFVRSPYAHARIRSIDSARARAMPGVVAVVSAAELTQWTTTLRMAPPIEGLQPTEIATLPVDKVRFQGDPVVCIVATDRYLAEDAAETVEIDYEVLPAVLSYADAVRDGAPLVDDSLNGNLVSHQSFAKGEVEARMRGAHTIVEASFSQHRQTHLPIETRGCVAVWDGGREHLTFHIGNQVPHPLRTQLAARLRLSESQVTVISPDVGGGFGQKIALYREELTVAALARHLTPAGALARGPHGKPAGLQPRPRADLPRARRRRCAGAHPGARSRHRGGLRRLLLLPGQLSGARGRHDPDRPVPGRRLIRST